LSSSRGATGGLAGACVVVGVGADSGTVSALSAIAGFATVAAAATGCVAVRTASLTVAVATVLGTVSTSVAVAGLLEGWVVAVDDDATGAFAVAASALSAVVVADGSGIGGKVGRLKAAVVTGAVGRTVDAVGV
jgi:hypothetical protein